MRFRLALFGCALALAHQVLAINFTVTATRDGKPIPQSEIKLLPWEELPGGWARKPRIRPNPKLRSKRANPVASSVNWCGSIRSTPSTNQIVSVHGVYQHPACSRRPGVTQYPQGVATWVGIDGDTFSSALLQAGTVCKINAATGPSVNEAWWQWFPAGAWTITTMPVAAGDWFRVNITTTSSTSAVVTLQNASQGYTYSMTITSGSTLARREADWILERPAYGSGLAGFATFPETWFVEAVAKRQSTPDLGILGAKQYQIGSDCQSAEWDDSSLFILDP